MIQKIFDGQGFLTKNGKAFVNDGFVKEMRKVIDTAADPHDVLVISGILKSLVGEYASTKNITTIKQVPEANIDNYVMEDMSKSVKLSEFH